MMREDNLLCVRRRRFLVTTDSRHNLPILSRNLANAMRPTAINQLWVADITYIRLRMEFVYSGRGARRILTASDRLGAGANAGSWAGGDGFAYGIDRATAGSRPGATTSIAVCSTVRRTTLRC